MDKQVFDIIIVGAGTAGCLLANRLSANKNLNIALIEAGGSDNYHWYKVNLFKIISTNAYYKT